VRVVGALDLGTTLSVSGSLNGQAQSFTFDPSAGKFNTTAAATLASFAGFGGNVRTAVGDVNGDGFQDTVLVTGPGTPIRFAVISGKDNATVLVAPTAPFAGSEDFTGGGFVAAADLNGDGKAEWVITPDQGGGPRVTVFALAGTTPTVLANFFGID